MDCELVTQYIPGVMAPEVEVRVLGKVDWSGGVGHSVHFDNQAAVVGECVGDRDVHPPRETLRHGPGSAEHACCCDYLR